MSGKKITTALVLVVLLSVGLFWWSHRSRQPPWYPETKISTTTNEQSRPATKTRRTTTDNWVSPVRNDPEPEYTRWYIAESTKHPDIEWKAPINFWGKVVDESNQPVENASIKFTWNDLSKNGTSRSSTNSDSQGLFALLNRKGKRLYVDVSKRGYYNFPGSAGEDLEYASPWEGNRFHPDPNNPLVFRLKKAGTLEPLLAHVVSLSLPNSGEAIEFDFIDERLKEPGSIQFRCTVEPQDPETRRFAWHFVCSVPSGGLLPRTNTLDFTAPTEGYLSAFEDSETQNSPQWRAAVKGGFFVKFGSPARYGRIEFEFVPKRLEFYKSSDLQLKYWVNPSGSQNLEADPAKMLEAIPSHYLRTGLPKK